MSKRLDQLERSLERKQDAVNDKIAAHFECVKSANGQPLNDKRNGQATRVSWERQNDVIRRLLSEIEKTEAAIEREKSAIARVESVTLPAPINRAIAEGRLRQWRKHPKTFFVDGVDEARIVLLDDGRLAHRHVSAITCADQWRKFAKTYNELRAEMVAGGPVDWIVVRHN